MAVKMVTVIAKVYKDRGQTVTAEAATDGSEDGDSHC